VKRCVRLAALLALVAGLPACYESDKPLDAMPQVDLDAALFGAWRCVGGEPQSKAEEDGLTLTVEAAGPRTYRATSREDGDQTPEVYEAYGSRVGQGTVLNVRELDESGKPKERWWFVRYQFARPQVLLVDLADDEALKGVDPSPGSLKKALAKESREGKPFDLLLVCVRARKE
jgi:hypothetical protein